MSTLSVLDWVMVVAGTLMVGAGGVAIWGGRVRAALAERRAVNGRHDAGVSPVWGRWSRLTEATRLSIGVVLAIVGFNLAAWGLPDSWGLPKVPAHTWPWLLGFAAVWVGGSLLMDARDRSHGVESGGDGADRDPN